MSGLLTKYHPRASYTYMPEARLRMPGPHGGYLVRANKAGFRSEREFVPQRNPDVFRALFFGDSQTAGDGVGNSKRFSDLLEASVPGLEIYNYAVTGHGPDQQLLVFEEQRHVDRDLLVFGLYVENIRRITRKLVKSQDANGKKVFRAKPYFEIENDRLEVHHVPVPREAWTDETLPEEFRSQVYSHGEVDRVIDHLKTALRFVPVASLQRAVKNVARRFKGFQLVPEYNRPDNPAWLLLRKILESFIATNAAPVLVVLIPHYFFLSEPSHASAYQARFQEFEQSTGCKVLDLLPALLECTPEERSAVWNDGAGHLSSTGHEVLARMMTPWLQRFMQERGRHTGPPADHGPVSERAVR